MNTFIKLTQKKKVLDDEGFSTITDVTLAEVHAYREGRHGSEKWANMAQFSEATDLFRFRIIPNLTVTKDMRILCDGHIFEITSVEDVKGRRMYIEVMAKEVTSSGTPQSRKTFWGCGRPVDASAEGRSTDRAGRRDRTSNGMSELFELARKRTIWSL